MRPAGIPGVGILGWSQEPVVGSNGEVDDMLVGLSVNRVVGVQDLVEVLNDGDVGRVGSLGGVIGLGKSSEESSQ